ncbi:ABC transporter ATP-binding protein [Buttiauxella sp. B2]|uniref:ABC transporter ATP-binding protein n=1 Tax=Buttiauxella sp. B2 TaxID=2587812 RepID=UPI00112452A8|nr:ABC transporter ATP-binding protein [Buttiauxella sp. B2]TNV22508.1 ABC transporter ATP-binding protein [Buttiauxella sp. B2]
MITFDQVSKHYPATRRSGNTLRTALAFRPSVPEPPFVALEAVSFHLPQGGALGVLGRNGAGKSTLLKLLTRVSRPTTGCITVQGRLSSLLEVGAGFHHDLSGRENIFLAGAILGMSPAAIRARMEEIVAFSGLADFLAQPVRTYSSGMFLRLAFSVGIHLDCDILVIDEALAVGDRDFQARCLAKIAEFRQGGGTLVLVSHDEHQLKAVCDRGLLLAQGRIQFDGDIQRALAHYTLSF